MIRRWQASCLMRVIQRRSKVRRKERRAVVFGSGRSRCVGCFCNLRAFVAGDVPRSGAALYKTGLRSYLIRRQRGARLRRCAATARHPSPVTSSLGLPSRRMDGLPSRSSFRDRTGPPPRRFATPWRGILRLHHERRMVAQICPRWNPLTSWMRQIEDFHRAA